MIQRKSEQLRRKSWKNSILKGGSTFSKSNPRYIHESVLARFRKCGQRLPEAGGGTSVHRPKATSA